MKDKYSHRERIEMIMAGETPDRFAASIWRHFFHLELSAENLAKAMLDYQDKYDWDFMKINPRASYHVEDWGCTLEWSDDESQRHRHIDYAVKGADDWLTLEVLSPESPVLAEHLMAIKRIKEKCDPELPLFMTVFTPLSIAHRLVGDENKMVEFIGQSSEDVLKGLETITRTFEKYAAEIRNAGADGLFFATTAWASSDLVLREQYDKFGRPFDLRILKAAGDDALNILHVCASNNYLMELLDYPAPLVNWDCSDPTNIPLDKSYAMIGDKTVLWRLGRIFR
jgi:uroporphyrinogen decarboxylase